MARPPRTHCILCGGDFAEVERAVWVFCKHLKSRMVYHPRRSVCVPCSKLPDMRARINRARDAERRQTPGRRDAMRQYVRAYRQQHRKTAPSRARMFKCLECGQRFKRQREAKRLRDGAWVRLAMCVYCAEQVVGPSKHEPPRRSRVFTCQGCQHELGWRHESMRLRDGTWVRLGMCAPCAVQAVGPTRR